MTAAGTPGEEPTLGERLARQVDDFVAGRLAVIPWLAALEPVLRRVASLPIAADSRLRRIEADVPALGAEPVLTQALRGEGQPPTAAAAPPARPQPHVERLPADLRERLRPVVGPEVERVRAHRDDRADEIARAHEADAVTVAEEIFFRAGRFRPDRPEGIALLVHEATHAVEAMRPNSAWRRATATSAAEEEALATERERAALTAVRPWGAAREPVAADRGSGGRGASPGRARRATTPESLGRRADLAPPGAAVGTTAVPPTAGPASSPTLRPMPAAEGRALGSPEETPETGRAEQADPQALQRALHRDLLRQIRTDAERGA